MILQVLVKDKSFGFLNSGTPCICNYYTDTLEFCLQGSENNTNQERKGNIAPRVEPPDFGIVQVHYGILTRGFIFPPYK